MAKKSSAKSKIHNTEIAVIGGGPGGYAAAFHAADAGLDVTLIETKPNPGGVCLHVGCIPSKALLHAAALLDESRHASEWGIAFDAPKIDLNALRDWKVSVVDKMVGGLKQMCKTRGVQFVQGRGIFIDSERLNIEDATDIEQVCYEKAILATGSVPFVPPSLDIGSSRLMNSTGALELPDVPKTLLVIGGGYIGLELATVYAALGSRVWIVEMTDGLLPGCDRDLVRPVQKRMEENVEAIYLNTKVTKIEEKGTAKLKVALEGEADAEEMTFDRVLVAVGRRPRSGGIGIENTKIERDEKGFVKVDAARRTTDPRIWAIGDVAGEPMLAHKATAEAKVAAEAVRGKPAAFDVTAIPAVVFTNPEVAWCGLTETQARSEGVGVEVRRFPWGASGRAATMGRSDGLTKVLCDPDSGLLLGMGIVGVGAGELIAEGVLALEMGATAEDLASVIHPHPTLSESLMESAELIMGSATHVYRGGKKKAGAGK